ncbi:hypothetical protein GCM10011506_22030 [Marivirga lumbricoides]|uniref:Toxin n=1 Tax=Marivirga lumbricoides TaxID=1046115 RepID=A0ABQ1M8H0_9BACT|nr:hypothetical protein GCM10011506_22030 [Marivirga lumbricoides]
MELKDEVESFLKDFKHKLGFWGLLFRSDRTKNFSTMLALEVSVNDIKSTLNDLRVSDYSEGPLEEVLYKGSDMWVFGKVIKKKEVYIKITMGLPSDKVICISFHIAEKKMKYPLK